MSVATFSPDNFESEERTEVLEHTPTNVTDLPYVYEIDRIVSWTLEEKVKKVALQFPDDLLVDAPNVASLLTERLENEVFILGDTTFGSCCVDEVAAAHMNADAVVHFGHHCFSKARNLPVLYVYTKLPCDLESLEEEIKSKLHQSEKLVLLYDVEYNHVFNSWRSNLSNLIIGRCGGDAKVKIGGRSFPVDILSDLEGSQVVFVSSGRGEEKTLQNLLMNLPPSCQWWIYQNSSLVPAGKNITRMLMRRSHLIEKCKDAQRIGILVGTLSLEKVDEILDKLRRLVKNSGRKCYTFLVGKPNVAKLANFPEIDVFVLVACQESSLEDCKEFLQPLVTPWELEVALRPDLSWGGEVVTDFTQVLKGGVRFVEESEETLNEEASCEVSLVSGRVRSNFKGDHVSNGELAVVNDKTISLVHTSGGGEFLASRTWGGLEQRLGQDSVQGPDQVIHGAKGIAAGYENEPGD